MVQILPQATSVSNEIGQSVKQGFQQGSDLAFQRSQAQKGLKELGNIPANSTPLDTVKTLISAFAGRPDGEKYISQILPFLLQQQGAQNTYGGGQPQDGGQIGSPVQQAQQQVGSGVEPQQSKQPQQVQQSRKREGIFDLLTNSDIQAEKARVARLGIDPLKREEELNSANIRNQANRDRLLKVAISQGIGEQRIPELLDYAATRPDLTTPEQVVGAAKREFEKAEKVDIPGLFTGLIGGEKAREKSLSNLGPWYQRMKRLGREQEIRSTLAENGVTETELGYLASSQDLPRINKAIDRLPDSPFKTKSPVHLYRGDEEDLSEQKYRRALEKNPNMIEKENEKLANFFRENVTPDTSMLVLRDKLWRKGYAWEQIYNAFNTAFPDESSLNKNQQAEVAELGQAPISSLGDLFGPGFWRRLSGFTQGKK